MRVGKRLQGIIGSVGVAVASATFATVSALPAVAETPVEIDGVVTDTTNSLGGADISAVETASAELRDKTNVTLYLVVVDTFESPADGFEWSTASIERSQLGQHDVVLYVGEAAQEYGLNIDHRLNVGAADKQEIERQILSDIVEGDYAAAAVDAATQLDQVLRADEISAEKQAAVNTTLGVGAAGTAVVGGTLYVVGKRRKKKAVAAEAARRAASFKKRSDEAGVELVRMDNLIRSSEEELQFARAQFGSEVTADYAAAIDAARTRGQQAFALQAKLFDHIPDSEEQQDAWLEEIISLTQQTGSELSEQQAIFAALQERQSQVPQLVASLNQQLPALRARAQESLTWIETLAASLDEAAISPIREDHAQAQRLLALAHEETENAQHGWDAQDQGAAIVDVTDAESAISQAVGLLDGLDAARKQIIDAPAVIGEKTASVDRLLVQLRQLRHADPEVIDVNEQEQMSHASAVLTEVSALGGVYRNPIHTTAQLVAAEGNLQEILTESLDEKSQLDEARNALTAALSDARAEIAVTEQFINSHRGTLSSSPRARLAQAIEQLERAEVSQADDPVQALRNARDAARLARAAKRDADDEASQYSGNSLWVERNFGDPNAPHWPEYGQHRRYRRNDPGTDITGAIIGGIIGGLLNSAGSSHRSSGSWSSGGSFSGGGGGGWSSGGGFR